MRVRIEVNQAHCCNGVTRRINARIAAPQGCFSPSPREFLRVHACFPRVIVTGLTVHAVVFALGLSFFAFQLYVQVAYVSSHVKKHLVDSVEAAVLDSVRRQPPSVPQSPARNPDGNGARAKAE